MKSWIRLKATNLAILERTYAVLKLLGYLRSYRRMRFSAIVVSIFLPIWSSYYLRIAKSTENTTDRETAVRIKEESRLRVIDSDVTVPPQSNHQVDRWFTEFDEVKEINNGAVDSLPLRHSPAEDRVPTKPATNTPLLDHDYWFQGSWQVPTGFSGPSGILEAVPYGGHQSIRSPVPPVCGSEILSIEATYDRHFVPVVDRWRIGYPEWDRYGPDQRVFPDGDPFEDDNPYSPGSRWNPYRQNVWKGDYPIVGQHTFLNVSAQSLSNIEFRQVPTATTPFESTDDPFSEDFFGNPDQFFFRNDFKFAFDLTHGDAGFKPADWRIRIAPVLNLNYLKVQELGIVNPDVREGKTRYRNFLALEEFFFETKLADTSPNYDFVSLRAGSQQFVSDFRGFIFADINLGLRLFGTRRSNREQFNFAVFDQFEKETNSELNRFKNRPQNIFIANYYRQDFIWPGYTTQFSFHYNQDRSNKLVFDRNRFLVRPDPTGVFQPHRIDAVYLGWSGDGHINRINVNHALYLVYGQDDLNPLAGKKVSINAQMAALELSYDRDWMRFRTSVLFASGDNDISDGRAKGFDAIMDKPAFAGGEFSYWQRQAIRLQGVNLVDRASFVPHLRSSKIQGQTNFVNPGLFLFNVGNDMEISPRLRVISNINLLWFSYTEVLEQFLFQAPIRRHIGTDLSVGFEWRPLLNDNLIVIAGVSGLVPGRGFSDIFSTFNSSADNMFASFIDLVATY